MEKFRAQETLECAFATLVNARESVEMQTRRLEAAARAYFIRRYTCDPDFRRWDFGPPVIEAFVEYSNFAPEDLIRQIDICGANVHVHCGGIIKNPALDPEEEYFHVFKFPVEHLWSSTAEKALEVLEQEHQMDLKKANALKEVVELKKKVEALNKLQTYYEEEANRYKISTEWTQKDRESTMKRINELTLILEEETYE